MTNREAFDEFVKGFVIATGVAGVIVTLVALTEKTEPVQKFKVVDHYGTCAVVRYTDKSNDWHYFLDCGNQHLN